MSSSHTTQGRHKSSRRLADGGRGTARGRRCARWGGVRLRWRVATGTWSAPVGRSASPAETPAVPERRCKSWWCVEGAPKEGDGKVERRRRQAGGGGAGVGRGSCSPSSGAAKPPGAVAPPAKCRCCTRNAIGQPGARPVEEGGGRRSTAETRTYRSCGVSSSRSAVRPHSTREEQLEPPVGSGGLLQGSGRREGKGKSRVAVRG